MNKAVTEMIDAGRSFGRGLSGLKALLLAVGLVMGLGGTAMAADPSVLVVPFAVNATPDSKAQLERDLPALLESNLRNQGFSVIMGGSSTQDPSRAKDFARQAGAQYAVYGSLNQVGDAINLSMRLVEVSGSMMRPFNSDKGSILELPAAVSELTRGAYNAATNRSALADIRVRGVQVLDPDRVLVRVQSRKGDPVNVDIIDEDIRRIWDLGYFSDVSADLESGTQGDILVFTVVEKPRIDDVRVVGSSAVKIGDITEAMSSRTGTVLNEKMLAEDIQKVTELYRTKGYYLADVNYEVTPRGDGSSAALVFHVTEGNRLYVKEVAIDGLSEVRRKDIEKYLALKKRSILSWFTGTGVLKEDLLERDSQAIQSYMVNQGYIDAQVSAPDIQYMEDGIRISYTVREGQRYRLGEIGFLGDLLETEDVMMGLIKLDEQRDKKQYFSLEVIQEDLKVLTEYYNDFGYAFANVEVDSRPHEGEGVVDIFYAIDPREKVYIRRVEVEGNDKTRDNVIIREMRLADGQEFNGQALRRSTERLEKLRYFDEVDTQLVPTGTPGEVDLKVGVKEANTGMINIGFGYSTYDKFGVSGGIRESNLWGRGYQVGLQAYVSGKETSFNASFINPRLNNTKLGYGVNIYAQEGEWNDFDKRTYGGRLSFFYPLGEYTTLSWYYRLEQYSLRNVYPWASRAIRDHEGDNWASVVGASITRDTTNSATFPTRGTRTILSSEYGGGIIAGDDHFIKPMFEWGFFYGLNDNHVLHARTTLGGVFKSKSKYEVPLFERFYIGGMNSIRGYSTEDISPRDSTYMWEEIGSDRIGYANFEYIWGVQQDMGISLVPFFDVGFASDGDWFKEWYYSAGLEVRWRSPMGDLRFAYGFPLTDNVMGERKRSGRFEFSMGQAF